MGSNLDTYSSTIARTPVKQAFIDWFNELNPQFAFSGTALQSIPITDRDHDILNVERLSQNVQHLIKKLSRVLYGCREVKNGNWVKYAGYIEGDEKASLTGGKRLHAHMGLEIDESICRVPLENLDSIIERCWKLTKWGHQKADIQEIYGAPGWNNYILKEFNLDDTSRVLINIPKN